MAIKKSDWFFIRNICTNLKKKHLNSPELSIYHVAITKKDLRKASGRVFIRKSYQKQMTNLFNKQDGISAWLDGDDIYLSLRIQKITIDDLIA